MIDFQSVRTARFEFTLQELTLGQVRALCNMHPDFIEKQRTFFIKSALKDIKWNKGLEHLTIDDLTVEERLLIESSYLSVISDVPNFELGNANYYDYLTFGKQYLYKEVELGLLSDDKNDDDIWFIRPLTGLQVEVIEERILGRNEHEKVDWILYAMACQLFRKKDLDQEPDIKENTFKYGEYLDEKVSKFNNLPESVAIELINLYMLGSSKIQHLFNYYFDGKGIFITCQKEDEKGELNTYGARFLVDSLIDSRTFDILGKHQE